jgi:hypothetical protein
MAGSWVRLGVAAFVFAAASPTGLNAAPKANFDGIWNVQITTHTGACNRSNQYALRIANGVVQYDGDAAALGLSVSGRVGASGRVQINIAYGDQRAAGTGRLSSARGAGTWLARSPTAECRGRWQAERLPVARANGNARNNVAGAF